MVPAPGLQPGPGAPGAGGGVQHLHLVVEVAQLPGQVRLPGDSRGILLIDPGQLFAFVSIFSTAGGVH